MPEQCVNSVSTVYQQCVNSTIGCVNTKCVNTSSLCINSFLISPFSVLTLTPRPCHPAASRAMTTTAWLLSNRPSGASSVKLASMIP